MLSPVVQHADPPRPDASRYAAKKQEKGLVDFNDLGAIYCLAVLRDPASTPENLCAF